MKSISVNILRTSVSKVKIVLLLILTQTLINCYAQNSGSQIIDDIIVEKYFECKQDITDTIGNVIPKGSITYRIYVDLASGYLLNAVFGNDAHTLRFETTTRFYNNKIHGQISGDEIPFRYINEPTLLLDSWVALTSASQLHMGILKSEDKDGSIITSLKGLDKADGLIEYNNYRIVYPPTFNIDFFNKDTTAQKFETNNGGWANLKGAKGPTETNRILIAQLTTDGELSFEFHIQVKTTTGDVFKVVSSNPASDEFVFEKLKSPFKTIN